MVMQVVYVHFRDHFQQFVYSYFFKENMCNTVLKGVYQGVILNILGLTILHFKPQPWQKAS